MRSLTLTITLFTVLALALCLVPAPADASDYCYPETPVNIYVADVAFSPIDLTVRDIFFSPGVPRAVSGGAASAAYGAARQYAVASSTTPVPSAAAAGVSLSAGLPGYFPAGERPAAASGGLAVTSDPRSCRLRLILAEDSATDEPELLRGYADGFQEAQVVRRVPAETLTKTTPVVREDAQTLEREQLLDRARIIADRHKCQGCHRAGVESRGGGLALFGGKGDWHRGTDWNRVLRYVTNKDEVGRCPPPPRTRVSATEEGVFRMLAGGKKWNGPSS